jgi:glycosyltransferase involved in cell wall biosynthesis
VAAPALVDGDRAGGGQVSVLRIAIVADYLEEAWPSMDLVADMLLQHLQHEHAGTVSAVLVRPPMPRRLSRAKPGEPGRLDTVDRLVARQWDYPRLASRLDRRFDVFHVIDHSYAHLVHSLPADRTIVTCHDLDAFRSVLEPQAERRSAPYRWMASRILSGLRRAAHVPCDSDATRDALISLAGFPGMRLSVIPNGSATTGWADPGAHTDFEAARMLGPRGGTELLHVGSTIPRKRIDVLLDVFAAVRAKRPEARLVRVGGAFTAEQRVRARELGVLDAIVVLPFVDRATLGAVYRRATVALLPSEREGFGLPLVEALGCGTPVVASDIPVLREVGGDAAEYCPVGDVAAWRDAILRVIDERITETGQWESRRRRAFERAADFSWSRYAAALVDVYRSVAGGRA